jgi:hypothetical protein
VNANSKAGPVTLINLVLIIFSVLLYSSGPGDGTHEIHIDILTAEGYSGSLVIKEGAGESVEVYLVDDDDNEHVVTLSEGSGQGKILITAPDGDSEEIDIGRWEENESLEQLEELRPGGDPVDVTLSMLDQDHDVRVAIGNNDTLYLTTAGLTYVVHSAGDSDDAAAQTPPSRPEVAPPPPVAPPRRR